MPGIVSIVDGAAGENARRYWELLERELGLAAAPPGAIPHVSHHVSEHAYRTGSLIEDIERAVAGRYSFEAASTGLGVFAGEPPVLYLSVTRSPELLRLQQALWQVAEPHSDIPFVYGHADHWVPHITLAMDGLTPELTARAVALLLPRIQPLRFGITNVALLDELTGAQPVVRRWELGASKVAKR